MAALTYTLILQPQFLSLLADGTPNYGGFVFSYLEGTTTPATTYQDVQCTIPNTNPVILNADGIGEIFSPVPISLIVQDQYGVQLYTYPNYYGISSNMIASIPAQNQDYYWVWDDVSGKVKNSTVTSTDMEQIYTRFQQATLNGNSLCMASLTDTVPGDLYDKISPTGGLSLTVLNPGGNETLQFSFSAPGLTFTDANLFHAL